MSPGLRNLKRRHRASKPTSYHRYIVVGEDIFSLALAHQLWRRFGPQEVFLLAQSGHWAFSGPNTLRGEDNIRAFQELHPEVSLRMSPGRALFYKQAKFHPFGGDVPAEKLCFGEEFFTWPHALVDRNSLFPCLSDNSFLADIGSSGAVLLAVQRCEPQDLLQPAHYRLCLSDGVVMECQELYWGRNPGQLLNLCRQADQAMIDFCQTRRPQGALHVRYEFDGPLASAAQFANGDTLFFPLSYTHPCGHFIGEFGDSGALELVSFFDADETSEEDISKRIKLIGRRLEKAFVGFKRACAGRFIRLEESGTTADFDERHFGQFKQAHPHLHFVGMNAPLAKAEPKLSFFARGIAGLSAAVVS